MKTIKFFILLLLLLSASLAILASNAHPIEGGLCLIAIILLGYLLNKLGLLLNPDDLCHR
jgi:hypothetical protein